MSKINKQENEELSEKIIDGALSNFKFHFLIISFMVIAVVPILSISEILKTKSPLASMVFIIWIYVFYKLSSSLHNKSIVSYWVSLPCALLVIVASFFY